LHATENFHVGLAQDKHLMNNEIQLVLSDAKYKRMNGKQLEKKLET
jgi:hypothetical protein